VGDPMIELRAITARYGPVLANDRLDLTVHRGELLTLLGPSGCGKTTALRTLTGHVRPESGRVVIDGRDVTDLPTHRRELGMVFQNFALFPHMTVRDNVGFPLMIRGVSPTERGTLVTEALRLVRLEGHAEKHPRQLSGGQQQRVGLARALVYRPKVLLLDEPLSNLDAKLREEMRFEIREVVTRLGVTAVYVTHDQEEALALSDRIAIMHRGRIEQLGTPEDIYARPASRFVAEFVGLSSFLDGVVEAVAADGMRVVVGGGHVIVPALPGAAPGRRALLFVRPNEVELLAADAPDAGALRATVEAATYLGDRMDYRLRLDGGAALRVQRDGGARLTPGTTLWLRLPPGRVRALSDGAPAGDGLEGSRS
jgi:ABC-type Fe3+/spermidine/putrescine transport system ATPase subunit